MGAPKNRSVPSKWTIDGNVACSEGVFHLSNEEGQSAITFDYLRAEGGIPFIETSKVISDGRLVEVEIIFSETFAGLQSATGKINLSSKQRR
jgi:hypothetical protein